MRWTSDRAVICKRAYGIISQLGSMQIRTRTYLEYVATGFALDHRNIVQNQHSERISSGCKYI
jgi:hypothetical protein